MTEVPRSREESGNKLLASSVETFYSRNVNCRLLVVVWWYEILKKVVKKNQLNISIEMIDNI